MNASPRTANAATFGRRRFIKQATMATAVTAGATLLKTPVYGQNQAPSPGRVIGANDRIAVAVIGLQRGRAHINGHLGVKNVEVGFVCDVDSVRLAEGKKLVATKRPELTATGVGDYRRLLENKDVDVISIAAPNYWQAIMTIQGCDAGKHVYVEKPGSHNPFEAEAMVAAAARTGRVVQMGNQRRSYPLVREAIDRLRNGVIGRVLYARCWYKSARPSIGVGRVVPVPANLDWALWQGPCPEQPYKDNLVHYQWHWRWHYGGGELANNGIHTLDLARWGLGVDYPTRVAFVGGRYHFRDDQETPDTGVVTYDFGGSGASWDFSSCDARKPEPGPVVVFHGEKGALHLTYANEYTIFDPEGKELEKKTGGRGTDAEHFQNFADAIREGKPLNSPIGEGQKGTMLCHLGNIAYRMGRTLDVDPKTGRILNDPAAMKLWQREYRAGWEPKGARA